MIENRAVGIKSRELYEAPAAIALIEAHRALEDARADEGRARSRSASSSRSGRSSSTTGSGSAPLRRAYDAFFAATQKLVTRRGAALAPARQRRSSRGAAREHALYAEALASYGTGETFPHEAAEGFIRIAALEVELAAARERRLDARMTLWSGRVGTGLAPEVEAFLRADDAELFFVRLRGDARRTPSGCVAAGLLTDGELARGGAAARRR